MEIVAKRKSIAFKNTLAPNFDSEDYRLRLMLACRRNKWMERLADTKSTKDMRLKVLEEALDLKTVDAVPAMSHLIRNFFDILN